MRVGDFVTLAHDRLGSGPPLLLLHAFGLSRAAWKPVVPLLAPERELLLVDLPGHGQSPMPPAGTPPNPEGYAREVARLLDELGLDAVDVCGNSIGGWTALELAKQGRASAVVALNPTASIDENEERIDSALEGIRAGSVAPASRDDAKGRFVTGDAVGFVGEEIVAWGGAGSTLGETMAKLGEGAEILTVIGGKGAPIALGELESVAPEGVELELHDGGQPNYWWLLAAQ
jgi:pimeloyl-ACP methyl ester carboxylesterase